MQDLHGTIELAREALSLRPPGHPKRSHIVGDLAVHLHCRFERTGQMQDLEEAMEMSRETLALLPFGHLGRFYALNSLANGLRLHFEQTKQMKDFEEAIKCAREALDLYPPGGFLQAICLRDLSRALMARFRTDSTQGALNEASDMFAAATKIRSANVGEHLATARSWAQSRELQHSSIVSAYAKCLLFLQRSLVVSPSLELQWNSITRDSSFLAVDAASSAIDKGKLDIAIEMLEQGRVLLWSRLKGYRQPVLELRAVDEALTNRFEMISNPLEQLAPHFSTTWDEQLKEQRILSKEWDDTVRRIREIEGFSDFLQPVPLRRLKNAAAEGPVIIINVSPYRSDASILRDVASDPTLVPLKPSLYDEVVMLSTQLGRSRKHDNTLAVLMHEIWRALWRLVAQPVVDQLYTLGVPEKSRTWLCPTGKLCSLPLHAAHPLVTGERGLPDLFMSSYTPTLSALISARENIPVMHSKYPQLLSVGRPEDYLRCVNEALTELRDFWGFIDSIVGEQVTPNAVLANLQTHPWAHIACHGHLDDDHPFESSFKLYGGSRLTVTDLLKSRLLNPESAFLSACHSATGDLAHTPDEVLHLAAAVGSAV